MLDTMNDSALYQKAFSALKEIACQSLEKVLITWQKDDASPFVAMRLKHENCFGGLIDRLATRFSTWFVFKAMNRTKAFLTEASKMGLTAHCSDVIAYITPKDHTANTNFIKSLIGFFKRIIMRKL